MIATTIQIPADLLRLHERIEGAVAAAVPAIALAAGEVMRENFLKLQQKGNRLGGERTNYWMRAADAVESTVEGMSVTVRCAQRGVRLHLYGGTVRPKGTSEITGRPIKFLTIPRVAAAHGKTVATLRSLGVLLYPGPGGLYRQTGAARNPATDARWFAFARQATITANAAVLPTVQEVAAAVAEAASNSLAAALAG